MSNMLDKALDDVVKEQKKNKKSHPAKSKPMGFKRDRPSKGFVNKRRSNFGGRKSHFSRNDKGRKIRVVNLNYEIMEQEVRDLFASIGKIKFCKILWDKQGRSLGKALVKYEYDVDHSKAIKEFDGAELDGRVLTVEYDR